MLTGPKSFATPRRGQDSDVSRVGIREDSKVRRSFLLEKKLVSDQEIMKGVLLRSTLRGLGRLWRGSPIDLPQEEKIKLWHDAMSVSEFDVFLSHTWHTKGIWKFLALSLQISWRNILLCWLLAIILMELLFYLDLLPPDHIRWDVSNPGGTYNWDVPYSQWGTILAPAVSLVPFLLAPYASQAQVCFLDVACIHQADDHLKERGIYGLGGFLKASKELRILWSPPYLSRLWCIFELGAYRMANPSGTISIKPLFVEVTVLACWLGIQLINLLWVLAVALTGDLAFYTLLPALVPLILIFHSMRQHLLARQQLLDGLARFDLNQVECRLDFDKKFVHEAISEWYGGPEAFTEYVRGPLHQELISANVRHVRQLVPCQYCCIIITPMLGVALNSMVGLAKAQAPLWIAVAFFFAVVLGLYVCWFALMIQLAFFLCDRFAKPWPCLDWLQTILIFLFFAVVCASGLQLGVIASDFGPGSALLWFWVVATTLWLTRGGWGQVCRFCDACFRARAGKGLSGPDS
ncbi:unnamed protein product [Durusdinium trenchii]|uniref:Uncharacterized protein n=1 Tax=Durusdinium trenchii TaxID=1381693 RepID=A0ABP0L1I1_9DINO